METGIGKRKLEYARQLLAEKKIVEALKVIDEVAKHHPEEMDPTLLAASPVLGTLLDSALSHFAQRTKKFDSAWDDDNNSSGGAAA